jgi:hypothetical protein
MDNLITYTFKKHYIYSNLYWIYHIGKICSSVLQIDYILTLLASLKSPIDYLKSWYNLKGGFVGKS